MSFTVRSSHALCLALLLIVVAVFLAACEQSTPTPTPTVDADGQAVGPNSDDDGDESPGVDPAVSVVASPEPTAEVVDGRVVLWHSWAGADGDALAAILTALQQRYPELTVDTLFVAYDDLPRTYTDAVAAGGGPDLVFAPNWWLRDLVEAESVLPLDDRVAPDLLETYYPAALDNLRVDGQLYGLPVNIDLVALYVNLGLISPQVIPETTEEWLALIEKNPEAGAGLYANLYHLYWGIPAYGGQLIDEEGVVVLDANSGAADFLTWLQAMSLAQGNFVDLDYGMLLDRFKKGEYPFFVDGPWAAQELTGVLGDSLTVALLPAGPAGPAQPWLSADGLFINPTIDAEQQRRALLLAQAITDAEAGANWAAIASRLPANRLAETGDDPVLNGFLAQAATAQSMLSSTEMEQVWGYGGDMLLKVLAGDQDPAAVVAETTALINDANHK